jgi:hypothetical protein
MDLEHFSRALRVRWLWLQWTMPDKPWCQSELPVDDIDHALFSTTTRMTVFNGKKAKFWSSSWLDGMSPATMFRALFSEKQKKELIGCRGLAK